MLSTTINTNPAWEACLYMSQLPVSEYLRNTASDHRYWDQGVGPILLLLLLCKWFLILGKRWVNTCKIPSSHFLHWVVEMKSMAIWTYKICKSLHQKMQGKAHHIITSVNIRYLILLSPILSQSLYVCLGKVGTEVECILLRNYMNNIPVENMTSPMNGICA